VSFARHAAIAAVTGTVVIAVAVVLLATGVPGAGRTADTRPVASAPHRPGTTATTPTGASAASGPAPHGAAPRIRRDDPRLGPYEAEAGCLRAGNAGMGDGSWDDYECVGGYGSWRIEPRQR